MKLWNIKLCQSYSSHYSPFMRALGSLMACGGQVGTEKKARVIHPLSFFLEPNTKLPCYFQWFKKCCESVELFVLALIHARNEGTWLWLDIKPCSYWRSHFGAQSTNWWYPAQTFCICTRAMISWDGMRHAQTTMLQFVKGNKYVITTSHPICQSVGSNHKGIP